jgi:hypothetical protein
MTQSDQSKTENAKAGPGRHEDYGAAQFERETNCCPKGQPESKQHGRPAGKNISSGRGDAKSGDPY